MLRIEVHDVGHGHCAVITAPNGRRIMIDCGCSGAKHWWPSVHYASQHIDALLVQNMDEDHVGDLPYLWQYTSIGALIVNPSISTGALASMKVDGGTGSGVSFLHDILSNSPAQFLHGMVPHLRELQAWVWWNRYGLDFTDTNNLSLVTFARYGGFTMLFTGDLEKEGWRALLRFSAFREALASVSVLVASHHGRENGCCEEAFFFMKPEIVIFSDDGIQYDTQNTLEWYRSRVRGIPDLQRLVSQGKRRVLTTRRDGSMQIDVAANGHYLVNMQGGTGSHFGGLLAPA